VSGEARLGAVLFALSDPLRRRVLERVAARPGATVTEICEGFEVSRFAVMRHLNVLEEAGIVVREAVGRERHVRLAPGDWDGVVKVWLAGLRKEER
jgi:DNA-binding transcriptional ArsR family regulator